MTLSWSDRRAEARFAAEGPVILFIDEPTHVEVRAELKDVSRSGFRAEHMYPAFQTGMIIRFEKQGVSGLARVAWNRISEEQVETGFYIVQPK